jgi:predicted transcriptional regulator
MEIDFTPELEAKLNQIASQTGKALSQVVKELVANYIDHDEWFKQEVAKGVASLDRGQSVPHEELRGRMERILGPR